MQLLAMNATGRDRPLKFDAVLREAANGHFRPRYDLDHQKHAVSELILTEYVGATFVDRRGGLPAPYFPAAI